MNTFLEPGADISTGLVQLPSGLDTLYSDLLKQHIDRSGVSANTQYLLLQAVTHAARPLRLLELAEMMRVVSSSASAPDLKSMKDFVRAVCVPLLEILADQTVSVIHHSFTEYLRGTSRLGKGPVMQTGPAHAQLALTCLRYLQAGCLDAVKVRENTDTTSHGWGYYYPTIYRRFGLFGDSEEAQSRVQYPFFEYATNAWHHHVRCSDDAGHDQTKINAELGSFLANSHNRKAWLHFNWPCGDQAAIGVTVAPHSRQAGPCVLSEGHFPEQRGGGCS